MAASLLATDDFCRPRACQRLMNSRMTRWSRAATGRDCFSRGRAANAAQHGAVRAALFHDKWRAARGARLGGGLVGSGEVALGITVAAVEDAAAGLLGHALGQFAGGAVRAGDAQGLRANVSALGVA